MSFLPRSGRHILSPFSLSVAVVFQAQLQHCKLLVLAFVQQVQLDLLSFHARCILLGLMLATIQITWLSPDPDTESVDEECR